MGIDDIWTEFKLSGSTKSFEELYEASYDVLFRYASFYVDSLDAEEIVLDLMLHLWTHRNSIDVHSSVESYFRRSVHNMCLNRLRKSAPSANIRFAVETGSEMDLWNITEDDVSIVVWEAMATLSPKCRKVFEMSRGEGMKNSEIAENMGMSKKTVEGYITKSLKQIRIFAKKHLILLIFLGI